MAAVNSLETRTLEKIQARGLSLDFLSTVSLEEQSGELAEGSSRYSWFMTGVFFIEFMFYLADLLGSERYQMSPVTSKKWPGHGGARAGQDTPGAC